jgi:hypothetical protein
MKNKNNLFSATNRMALLWGTIIMIFASSCQDREFWDPETRRSPTLDYVEIEPGTFVGSYSGGEWQISLPAPTVWNALPKRYILFYAHGIVDPVPYEQIKLPDDRIDGISVKDILMSRGLGYSTTSYRDNGLVVLDAVEDVKGLVELTKLFFRIHPDYSVPDFLFLGGPSEGGLVTVKTVEKYGYLFDGAISICGPIGDFQKQLQYNGDFHVLFNYFFGQELALHGIDLGNPRDGVHPSIMQAWKSGVLQGKIILLMQTFPEGVPQLLNTVKATVDMDNPVAMGTAVLELLRFNIMMTNDVKKRFGGVPFNNKNTVYTGSLNDALLNDRVQRIDERDYQRVLNSSIRKYETSGNLVKVPLATIHTTGDYITPYWHDTLFVDKIFPERNRYLHKSIPVVNFGHCTISIADVEEALAFLIGNVSSNN